MKSYKGLVVKYIKNEKRSVIPIFISIILTVSAIISVTFITQNILRNNLEEKKIVFGDYDVRLQKINNERLKEIEVHENIKDYALGKPGDLEFEIGKGDEDYLTNIDLENSWNKINVQEYAVEKSFFNDFINFRVVDGRLPMSENEIVVSSKVLDNLNMLSNSEEQYKVGSDVEFSKIDFENINKNKVEKVNYKIVGIIQTDDADSLFGSTVIRILNEKELADTSEEFEVFTYLNNPLKVEELAKDLGLKYIRPTASNMIDPFGYPAAEIKYPGYDKESYSSIMKNGTSLAILGAIAVFCLMAVYNTFNASVAKRIKVYGILRAIGGSMKQITYLIYSEALILYLVAAPIGLAIGYMLTKLESYILVDKIGLLEMFTMNLNLEVILITLFLVFVIVMFSVTSVLRKEGKLTPIEAIMDARGLGKSKKSLGTNIVGESLSGSGSEEDERKAVKEILDYEKTTLKFKIMKKVFKFEGEIAHKNITRDANTYKLTKRTLFVAMAIIIFFFVRVVNDTVIKNDIVKSNKWDMELTLEEKNFDNNIIDDIKATKGVEEVYRTSEAKVALSVKSDVVSKELMSVLGTETTEDNNYEIVAKIATVDENCIKLYEGIDKKKLDEGGVLLVNKATNYKETVGEGGSGIMYVESNPILKSKVGEKLILSKEGTVIPQGWREITYNENIKVKELNIVGAVDDDVLYSTAHSINIDELDYNVKILTTEEGLSKILDKASNNKLAIKTENNENRVDIVNKLEAISGNNNYKFEDVEGQKLRLERNINENIGLNIIFSITIIIMVILNLINTTNACILARRKELAGMRAIGMSKSQQRKMIIGEVFYIALSVAFTVIATVGLLSFTNQGVNISAGKVSVLTLIMGEGLIILSLMLVSTLTSIAPLIQASKFSIVDDLKED